MLMTLSLQRLRQASTRLGMGVVWSRCLNGQILRTRLREVDVVVEIEACGLPLQPPLLPEPPMLRVFELRLCMPVPSTGAAATHIYAYPAIIFSFAFHTPAYA